MVGREGGSDGRESQREGRMVGREGGSDGRERGRVGW